MTKREQYFAYKRKGLAGVYLNMHSASLKVGIVTGAIQGQPYSSSTPGQVG